MKEITRRRMLWTALMAIAAFFTVTLVLAANGPLPTWWLDTGAVLFGAVFIIAVLGLIFEPQPEGGTVVNVTQTQVAAPARGAEVVEATNGNGHESHRDTTRYPVDLYRMTKVPGVTQADADALSRVGINLTDEMLHADLDEVERETGFERAKIQRWRDLCELMAIKGIGPAWAERLVNAGVTSIPQLAQLTPEELNDLLLKSYQTEGADKKSMTLLERTLPERSRSLVAAAKRDARAMQN